MNEQELRARRLARQRARRARARRNRLIAVGGLLVVALAAILIGLAATGGGKTSPPTTATNAAHSGHQGSGSARAGHAKTLAATALPRTTVTGTATGKPGTATVPVLMYHVINPPPAGAPFPGLYVPSGEFAAQMQALKARRLARGDDGPARGLLDPRRAARAGQADRADVRQRLRLAVRERAPDPQARWAGSATRTSS